jgi:hypothetical protein
MRSDGGPWENAGFGYEEGDPEVGIQGGYYHWCSAGLVVDDDPAVDISEGWAFDHYVGEGANRYASGVKSLVCNDCGANVSWIEEDWDPEVHEHDDLRD